jgi:hypothetical protein
MRRVIRHESGLYLKKDGTWTSDWQQAEEFLDTTTAIAAKLRGKLTASRRAGLILPLTLAAFSCPDGKP